MSANKPGSDSSDFAAIAALAVAVVALCVAGAQVAQQYAASGEKIRLCDSSVYGPMPGRGRRTWNWLQLRFNVFYDMPQISINPDLWRFVHNTSGQHPNVDDDVKNLPNLLLSRTSLEDSAEILLRRPKWTWPFLVVRHWGWRSLLTWSLPVRPHPEADYHLSAISLTTVIATRGNPENLADLQNETGSDKSSEASETRESKDSDRPGQTARHLTMSVDEKAALLMETPRWLWPVKIARLWGWRTIFAWRIQRKPLTGIELQPSPYRQLPKLEFVANINTGIDSRNNDPFKHRMLRSFQQLLRLQMPILSRRPVESSSTGRYQKMRRDYAHLYKDQRPSEASWVYFCRSMQNSCGSILKYQMVKGDADRCPSDLPVVPMLVSLRDIVVLCLMSGMDFTRTDIRNRLVSMEGPAGVLLSSTHPILGSILRFIPRQTAFRLGQQQGRNDVRLTTHPAWLRRVVGKYDDPLQRSLNNIFRKLISEEDPHDLSQADRGSIMHQAGSSPAGSPGRPPHAPDRGGGQTSTGQSYPPTIRPWHAAVSRQQAIRSWTNAWPRYRHGTFDDEECKRRNTERRRFMKERLMAAPPHRSPHWSWASKLDTVRGCWATPWASRFDAGFCTKAQIIVIESLRLSMNSRCLHFVNPQGRPEHQPPDFLYPAVTIVPYGEKHRSPDSVLLKELPELRATKEIQWVNGFNDPIPPLMLVDALGFDEGNHPSPTFASPESMRSQIETDELMWIDSWLIEVAQCSDIRGPWLNKLDSHVHEAIELFHEDFLHQPPAEPNAGTSHRRKLGRPAMEYAQGSAGDLLLALKFRWGLSHPQIIYFLTAMLRTFKIAYCIATGVDTKDAMEIFEKEISVYFA